MRWAALLLILLLRDTSARIEPQAVGAPAEDAASAEEILSLSDLEKEWNNAKALEDKTKKEMDDAETKLNEKRKDAAEPTRIYDEKKKEWERLDKIAQEKKAEWRGQIDTALAEYKEASDSFATAKRAFEAADREAKKVQGKCDAAVAEIAQIDGRPARLLQLQGDKTAAETRQLTATAENGQLDAQLGAKRTALSSAAALAGTARQKCADNGCDEPAKASDQSCRTLRDARKNLNEAEERAQRSFNETQTALAASNQELTDLDAKIANLETEISNLNDDMPESATDRQKAERSKNKWNGQLPALLQKVDDTRTTIEKALAAVTEKEPAKDEAERAEQAGPPADLVAAETSANHANLEQYQAEMAKKAVDDEVGKLDGEFTKAKDAHTAAKSAAESWQKRYEAEKRREEQASKGISPASVGGIVAGVVLLVAVVVFVVAYCKGWACFARCKKGKAAPTPSSGLAGVEAGSTAVPAVAAAPKSQKASKQRTPSDPSAKQVTSTASNGSRNSSESAATPVISARPKEAVVPHLKPGELPPIVSIHDVQEGIIKEPPGYVRYVIDAKDFKNTGDNQYATRAHGEPVHDLEGTDNNAVLEEIKFDRAANTYASIGPRERAIDTGPPSFSEPRDGLWLKNAVEWEKANGPRLDAVRAEKARNRLLQQVQMIV